MKLNEWEKLSNSLVKISDQLYKELDEQVARVMAEAGEDPWDENLRAVRRAQVAFAVYTEADKEFKSR